MSENNFQQYGDNTIDSSDKEELPNFEIVFNFNRKVSGELNTEEEKQSILSANSSQEIDEFIFSEKSKNTVIKTQTSRLGHKNGKKTQVRNLRYGPRTRLIRSVY